MKWIKDRFPIVIVLLCLTLTYIVLVFSNGPHSQYEHQTHTDSNTSEQSRMRPKPSLPITNIVKPPPTQDGENKEDWQTRDSKAQVQMMRAAWVAVGMTFIGLVLVAFTLYYTRNAAKAASATLNSANSTLEHSKAASQNELRAYISFEGFSVEPLNNGIRVGISCKNVGQTPAKNVKVSWCIRVGTYEQINSDMSETEREMGGSFGTVAQGSTRSSHFDFTIINGLEWVYIANQLKRNKQVIWVLGWIEYLDIYDIEHATFFSGTMAGNSARKGFFAITPEYNEMT